MSRDYSSLVYICVPCCMKSRTVLIYCYCVIAVVYNIKSTVSFSTDMFEVSLNVYISPFNVVLPFTNTAIRFLQQRKQRKNACQFLAILWDIYINNSFLETAVRWDNLVCSNMLQRYEITTFQFTLWCTLEII